MLLLSKEDIKEVFTMKDAFAADKDAFALFSAGKSDVPLRTQIMAPKQEGTFLFMPSYISDIDAAGIKIIDIFSKNIDKDLPTSSSQVILIDGETGIIIGILDGNYVTGLRTGAASGVAFDILGKKDAKIGALIGTGGQAAYQLEAMLCSRDLDEVRVYSRNHERTCDFVNRMNVEMADYGTKIIGVNSSDEAIDNADLIITVTPSTKPVFDGNKVKAGATVSCIGSYQPQMQEMPPEILTRASKLYFDSKDAVLSEAGDILIPLHDGTITEDKFTGDIGDVILGNLTGRENDEEIIVFKSVGIGTQDLVTAKAIYDKSKKNLIGTEWN
ncbi:MAG: ornithine cyclodeaminase family protein [Lachnospiraceae bacterium]|jgi:ornithine cyclodeaminase|nr:ornithine cyclodeaminase family protein [Lachnospiraceae bacterium]